MSGSRSPLKKINFGIKIIVMVVVSFIVSYVISFLFFQDIIQRDSLQALLQKSKSVTLQAQSSGDYVSDLRGEHNVFAEERILEDTRETLEGITSTQERLEKLRATPYYYTIPIVVSWITGQSKADELGHEFRVVRMEARNSEREARGVEVDMLKKMKASNLMEYHIIDEEKNVLRYMRAVVLDKECMVCHGTVEDYPEGNGLDPVGFKMEGWSKGETHGALEILASLEPMQRSVRAALIQIAAVSAGIILVVIGLIFFLVRRLAIKPVRSIRSLMEDLAKGNLNRELEQNTEDDIGKTIEAVNNMVANLRRIIGQIQDSSYQVSDAAGQISDANNSFSQMISEQAASVEETSSTIEEMTASIENTAENITDANRIAETTRRMAEEGIPVMENTISGMDEINDSSERIANITNVIEDIAFQTNLLALNASVEAARAGDHGRGFAVVAGEVRNLAQRSSSSVKEITELINESRGKTQTGVELARKLGNQLEEIVESVRKTTDYINEVSAAMMEQRDGVRQVNTAVDQIDKVTQQNASLVEENAASAEELAAQAKEQLAMISFFQIEKRGRRGELPEPDDDA